MGFVQMLANCRKFGNHSGRKRLSFQPLVIGTSVALYASLDAISTRRPMLRITRNANGEVVFKISGELYEENVAEIWAVIAAEEKGTHIALDLTDLRSVDGEAVKSLEQWEAESIKLKNCAAYIREWIRRQRVERQSVKET